MLCSRVWLNQCTKPRVASSRSSTPRLPIHPEMRLRIDHGFANGPLPHRG
jgi:hypothetical protein